MILHQTFGSARAERPTEHMPRRMMRLLLTSLLTSALTLPSLAARGIESLQDKSSPAIFRDTIKLPPIPQLDSVPWIEWNTVAPTLKTDILIEPSARPSRTFQAPQARNHMTIS
jgi:hypothetical protein